MKPLGPQTSLLCPSLASDYVGDTCCPAHSGMCITCTSVLYTDWSCSSKSLVFVFSLSTAETFLQQLVLWHSGGHLPSIFKALSLDTNTSHQNKRFTGGRGRLIAISLRPLSQHCLKNKQTNIGAREYTYAFAKDLSLVPSTHIK